jgi:hypothetical protein
MLLLPMAAPAGAVLGDVAPGHQVPPFGWCPEPDGLIDGRDGLLTLLRALGFIQEWSCAFEDSFLDVSPPARVDHSTSPPTFVPGGDGVVRPDDALLIVRAAVGSLRFAPTNPRILLALSTSPRRPSLGDVDPFLFDEPFPHGFGDIDCDEDGEFDPDATETFFNVGVDSEVPPSVPYQVCLWMKADAQEFDFDAEPRGNCPGPEDHDGGEDGVCDNPPPPPDHCVTVCPESDPDADGECATTIETSGNSRIVAVGPVLPGPPANFQDWTAVVDFGMVLDDQNFSDNVLAVPTSVEVRQCPDLAPDLVPGNPRLSWTPLQPTESDSIVFRANVKNDGNLRASRNFDVDLYIDFFAVPEQNRCGPVPVAFPGLPCPAGDAFRTVAASVSPLLEGGSVTVAFPPQPPLPMGRHQAMVLWDSTAAIVESDESNNLHPQSTGGLTGAFCVGSDRGFAGPFSGGPDLAITRVDLLDLTDGSPIPVCERAAGDRVNLEVVIENLASNPDAKDLTVGTLSAFALNVFSTAPGGGSSLDGFEFSCFPVGFTPPRIFGDYRAPLTDGRLTVALSSAGIVADIDTSNNTVRMALLNVAPEVNAGVDRSGTVAEPISINGSVEDPNDAPPGGQPPSIRWTVVSRPSGSRPEFSDDRIENPEFTADRPGTYELRVEASDSCGLSASDTAIVALSPPAE